MAEKNATLKKESASEFTSSEHPLAVCILDDVHSGLIKMQPGERAQLVASEPGDIVAVRLEGARGLLVMANGTKLAIWVCHGCHPEWQVFSCPFWRLECSGEVQLRRYTYDPLQRMF